MQAAQDGPPADSAVPRVHLHASETSALGTGNKRDLKKYAAEPEASRVGGKASR